MGRGILRAQLTYTLFPILKFIYILIFLILGRFLKLLCITNVVYAPISITFMINLTIHGNLEGRLYSKCMTVKSIFRKSIQSVMNRRKKPDCHIAIRVNGYFHFCLAYESLSNSSGLHKDKENHLRKRTLWDFMRTLALCGGMTLKDFWLPYYLPFIVLLSSETFFQTSSKIPLCRKAVSSARNFQYSLK